MRTLFEIERDIKRLDEEKAKVIAEYKQQLKEGGREYDEEQYETRCKELCKGYHN